MFSILIDIEANDFVKPDYPALLIRLSSENYVVSKRTPRKKKKAYTFHIVETFSTEKEITCQL